VKCETSCETGTLRSEWRGGGERKKSAMRLASAEPSVVEPKKTKEKQKTKEKKR